MEHHGPAAGVYFGDSSAPTKNLEMQGLTALSSSHFTTAPVYYQNSEIGISRFLFPFLLPYLTISGWPDPGGWAKNSFGVRQYHWNPNADQHGKKGEEGGEAQLFWEHVLCTRLEQQALLALPYRGFQLGWFCALDSLLGRVTRIMRREFLPVCVCCQSTVINNSLI